ncbi:MAG: hypothetical protein Q7U76_11245 [Nitrospirota bacterium]|nr:hypothetical protein [Nitrospirota bacterium]
MKTTTKPNRPRRRACHICSEFSEEAMYLLHGKNICEKCGVLAVQRYSELANEPLGDPSSKVHLKFAGFLALCLLMMGLAACDGGSDSVDMTGTQKCTVTVNEKEKPCH